MSKVLDLARSARPATLISRGGLLLMLVTSGIASGAVGVLGLGALVTGLLDGELVGQPVDYLILQGIFGLACLLKAGVELAGALRVRLTEEGTATRLPTGIRWLAFAWLLLFWLILLLVVLNLAYLFVLIVVAVFGLVLALLITLSTLGFGAKDAFSRYTETLASVSAPFEVEGRIWQGLWESGIGATFALLLLAAMSVGPTAYAGHLLWRTRAARRRSAAESPPAAPEPPAA
ncbi:MAG: hypothetical protein RBU45_17405 [Myxococcota bacterium]|jgi:hypothetical protein|nr:hypothetical protein [Myxococcota bacterium]